jgi:hypothetical protein
MYSNIMIRPASTAPCFFVDYLPATANINSSFPSSSVSSTSANQVAISSCCPTLSPPSKLKICLPLTPPFSPSTAYTPLAPNAPQGILISSNRPRSNLVIPIKNTESQQGHSPSSFQTYLAIPVDILYSSFVSNLKSRLDLSQNANQDDAYRSTEEAKTNSPPSIKAPPKSILKKISKYSPAKIELEKLSVSVDVLFTAMSLEDPNVQPTFSKHSISFMDSSNLETKSIFSNLLDEQVLPTLPERSCFITIVETPTQIYPTYSPQEYDRANPEFTRQLRKMLITSSKSKSLSVSPKLLAECIEERRQIIQELNDFKRDEMIVHPLSKQWTSFVKLTN